MARRTASFLSSSTAHLPGTPSSRVPILWRAGRQGHEDGTPACPRPAGYVTPARWLPSRAYLLSRQKTTAGGMGAAHAALPAGTESPSAGQVTDHGVGEQAAAPGE